ncbi:hypothetical protein, partial [Halovulum marinum]|uniref:hypothetical protein n=1 Tax=Halovulum marinum TaxID=2662447 RepID=UPI001F174E67
VLLVLGDQQTSDRSFRHCPIFGGQLSSGAEEFWFDRELALCEDCQGVVAMEKFPDRAVFDEAQKRHSSLWRGALRRYGKDEAGRLAEKEGFGVLEQVTKLQRPPVCLACGGTAVEPIHRPRGGSNDTSIRPLGMSIPVVAVSLPFKDRARTGLPHEN